MQGTTRINCQKRCDNGMSCALLGVILLIPALAIFIIGSVSDDARGFVADSHRGMRIVGAVLFGVCGLLIIVGFVMCCTNCSSEHQNTLLHNHLGQVRGSRHGRTSIRHILSINAVSPSATYDCTHISVTTEPVQPLSYMFAISGNPTEVWQPQVPSYFTIPNTRLDSPPPAYESIVDR